jgi:signal transduction histidine kinase
MNRRNALVYGLLIAAFVAIIGWQAAEHARVRRSARAEMVNRARYISTTLGILIRSQARFGSLIRPERLESALKDLIKTNDLTSVSLLNVVGEVVASAGDPVNIRTVGAVQRGEWWTEQSVTLVVPVDLGTNVVREGESARPLIVLPRLDSQGGTNSELPGPPRPDWWQRRAGATNGTGTNRIAGSEEGRRPPRNPADRPPFGRPPWMSEDEYKSLIQKQGLHSFVVVMSTRSYLAACGQDFWLRTIIGVFGAVAVSGLALAWRNVVKSSELQMRLLRASELNKHLKEMNIAAAGLAHETRNPLNIIRGIAQMISKQADASTEIRGKSGEIADEVDRVTAQLNEFINYSRPREIRRAPIALNAVVADIVRALDCDLEEKTIRLTVVGDDLTVDADEQLLRQVLFNLVMNAIQAVDAGGHIQITSKRDAGGEAYFEIGDNGPGVPVDLRREIFKPYFTMNKNGTGLGLAVVHQIILAHGWNIECLANSPRGAIFRVSGLEVSRS